MSRGCLRLRLLAGGVLLLLAPARSQVLPAEPPPLPSLLDDPSPEALRVCVPRYGHTGCAARLYARLLCVVVGVNTSLEEREQQLDAAFQQAAIDFRGISAAQIEATAVTYYAPMLCPQKSPQIRGLFASLAPAPER